MIKTDKIGPIIPLGKDWFLDTSSKSILCKKSFLKYLFNFIGVMKITMEDLYKLTYTCFHNDPNSSHLMSYPFPFEHDNFPKPEKYPHYFKLNNGWKINKKCLKYICNGPLFSETTSRVLVHSKIFFKPLLQIIWNFFVILSVLMTLSVGGIQLFKWFH
jgi:hypothetical protein